MYGPPSPSSITTRASHAATTTRWRNGRDPPRKSATCWINGPTPLRPIRSIHPISRERGKTSPSEFRKRRRQSGDPKRLGFGAPCATQKERRGRPQLESHLAAASDLLLQPARPTKRYSLRQAWLSHPWHSCNDVAC